jgi:hypothetical protein
VASGAPMTIAWDHLSDFEQFSLLIHGFKGEHRFMGLMKIAYCDESGDHRSPKIFAVSGYLGVAADWFELGRRWKSALMAQGLTTTGFHMSKCENRSEAPYDTMDRDRTDFLQRLFIDIIREAPLWGFASAIEQEHFDNIIRKRQNNYRPYYLPFRHVIEGMSMVLEDAGFPTDEPIAFVFDQHQEYQNYAKDLYDSMKRSKTLSYIHRLGSLTFDSRLCRPQLQVADIWAYESMRYIREVKIKGGSTRWQFDRLCRAEIQAHHNIYLFGREEIHELARLEGI